MASARAGVVPFDSAIPSRITTNLDFTVPDLGGVLTTNASTNVPCCGPVLPIDGILTNSNVVGFSPSLTREPQGQSAVSGDTVRISSDASGSAPLEYQWFFENNALPFSTNPTLTLTNVTPLQEGAYFVRVSNPFGTAQSAPAYVTVDVPPAIATQPVSIDALAGTEAVLTVKASGTHLNYQWLFNRTVLAGETNSILIIRNVQSANAGSYSVRIWNLAGSVLSDGVRLTVAQSPPIDVEPALALADDFADRKLVSTSSGSIEGTNADATQESSEPKHAGKNGHRSVWLAWRAPASGIATFSTAGSTFDTLLAIYTGSNLASLVPVASNDDDEGVLSSRVQFNAIEGVEYQVAIDGVRAGKGRVLLNWSLEMTSEFLPVLSSTSSGKTVAPGDRATFSVKVNTPEAQYEWFHDGQLIPGEQGDTLTIDHAQPADVGVYYVRVATGKRNVLSDTFTLNISQRDPGQSVLTMVDKFADVIVLGGGSEVPAGSRPSRPIGLLNAPARGYSGTQLFSTYGSHTEPGEPGNCGIPGGASVWCSYQPPIGGTLFISTDGSDFDTTLGVYSGDGSSFETLTPVACDNDSGMDGRTSTVRFTATSGTTYYISIDGVNGASGHAVLTYNVGDPPLILSAPAAQNVFVGSPASFTVAISGTLPCAFQWRHNGVDIAGATQSTLSIASVQPADAGAYSVLVSNLVSTAVSTGALLTVNTSPAVLSGGIASWASGAPIPSVILQVAGGTNTSTVTGTNGLYEFQLPPGGNYSLTPWRMEDSPLVNGVSTFDLALIHQRLLNQQPWSSPYQLLAADVNGSGGVDAADIALIRQMVVGMSDGFPAGLWRFVPSDYAFADPQNPWSAPSGRTYPSLVAEVSGQSFIGIKLGDVNDSAVRPMGFGAGSPSSRMAKAARRSVQLEPPSVRFAISTHLALSSSVVKSKVLVSSFKNVTTAQFALDWDPSVLRYLGVDDVANLGLTDGNFGTNRIGQGVLAFSWDDPTLIGLTQPNGAALLAIRFEVVGAPGSSSPVRFTDSPTPRETTVALALAHWESQDGEVTVVNSGPLLSCAGQPGQDSFKLSVPTAAAVRYILETSEAVTGSVWQPVSALMGDGTVLWFTLPPGGGNQGFYRVRAE